MPQLFNTIIVYDVYAYAESAEDARAAALANIHDGEFTLKPSQETALETGRTQPRTAWADQPPLVGPAVSDADFEAVKGKTCQQVWDEQNKKPVEKK